MVKFLFNFTQSIQGERESGPVRSLEAPSHALCGQHLLKNLAFSTLELVLGSAMNCLLTSFPDLFIIFLTT